MRKMIGPDFMIYFKEMRFEMKEITDRLRNFILNTKRSGKDEIEIHNMIEKLEKLNILIDDLYFRIGKGMY